MALKPTLALSLTVGNKSKVCRVYTSTRSINRPESHPKYKDVTIEAVLEDGDRHWPVGEIQIDLHTKWENKLAITHSLVVMWPLRQKGIAKLLINEAERIAGMKGAEAIEISTLHAYLKDSHLKDGYEVVEIKTEDETFPLDPDDNPLGQDDGQCLLHPKGSWLMHKKLQSVGS